MTPEEYEAVIQKQKASIEFYKELANNYQDYARKTPDPIGSTLLKYIWAVLVGYLLAKAT